MKYLKIYEGFMDDYERKFKELEYNYRSKVYGSLLTSLEKLSKMNEIYSDEELEELGIYIDRDESLYERKYSNVAIYVNELTFEKDGGDWYCRDQNLSDFDNLGDIPTNRIFHYLKEVIKKYSSIFNRDLFNKINQ